MASKLLAIQSEILVKLGRSMGVEEDSKPGPQLQDRTLLNSVGPAAASAAVEYAIHNCRRNNLYRDKQFTGSFVQNVQMVQNDESVPYGNFSNSLRQYLLPRTAYYDFDSLVDPRHRVDEECGYPRYITPIMYRYMYDRDDVARRVVDIYPDETWAADVRVYDSDDEKVDTDFEQAWTDLCVKNFAIQNLYRMDKLSGVGHFGVLLFGLDDGLPLDQPVDEPELLAGNYQSFAKKKRKLLYLRPFDEYLSFIIQYDVDINSPRFGMPIYYNLIFLDMTVNPAGSSIGTRVNRRVHWSRVLHIADNQLSSMVFGTPRTQPVFNRLLDLRKIKGGSAEMFWKGAFPGISFEIDPRITEDDPDFDEDEFKRQVAEYGDGLQRYLTLVGIKANSLAPQVADPKTHIRAQMEAVATHAGIPLPILMGSEEGRMQSGENRLTWNRRLGRRITQHVDPFVLRGFVNHCLAVGILPRPLNDKYFTDWGDLNVSTDEDKANLALKWTQALTQYVAGGIIHFISPMDYMTTILGITPHEASRIDDYIKENGGYEKLRAVEPSMSAGKNGLRENDLSKGDKSTTRDTARAKTDTADKEVGGMKG